MKIVITDQRLVNVEQERSAVGALAETSSSTRQPTSSNSSTCVVRRPWGQVCGLFGFGQIGLRLARKLLPLGLRVQTHDPYLDESHARGSGVGLASFDALLGQSDFISLHAPLNDETRQVFGEAAFVKMKSTASIIHTARGRFVDEAALLAAHDVGRHCQV